MPDSFYELDWKIKRVKVVYYDKCEYVLMEGMVTELDFENKKIIRIVNKNISLKDIVRIDGDYEISKEEIEAWKNEYGIDDSVTRLIIK